MTELTKPNETYASSLAFEDNEKGGKERPLFSEDVEETAWEDRENEPQSKWYHASFHIGMPVCWRPAANGSEKLSLMCVQLRRPNKSPQIKTLTLMSCNICAVCCIVGTGVLAMPATFASLTWVGAGILLPVTCLVSYYMSYLVAVMSATPAGERLGSFKDMCEAVIGSRKTKVMVLPFLYAGAIGLNIGKCINPV